MAGGLVKILDFYRKVPQDLTETTKLGKGLSIATIVLIVVMFIAEFRAFIDSGHETSLVMDPNDDLKLRINFNISMLELPCEYAAIDLYDVLGTNKLNYTKNVLKWNMDAGGSKGVFYGRQMEQRDLKHDDHHDLALLTAEGAHAVDADGAALERLLAEHEHALVAFVVPWCVWCQRLAPVWEALAQAVGRDPEIAGTPVVKVDCMANREVCQSQQKIHAFPTLRLFEKGKPLLDYTQDRTVENLTAFLRKYSQEGFLNKDKGETKAVPPGTYIKPNEHVGCQMSGFILVNRIPGNFHIEPRSMVHSFNAPMTNLSHVVHSLHFGHRSKPRRDLPIFESEHILGTNSVEEEAFLTTRAHQSPHHHLEIVSTYFESTFFRSRARRDYNQYQLVKLDNLVSYEQDEIPEAMFKYDLSPVAVLVKKAKRRWYHFFTSLAAVLGGTFTVVGLFNSALLVIFKPKKA